MHTDLLPCRESILFFVHRLVPLGLLLGAGLVSRATPAEAQIPELGRVSFEYVGGGEPEAAPAGADNIKQSTLSLRANAMLPVPLNEDGTLLFVGASYNLLAPQFDGVELDAAEFHEVGLSAGLLLPLNNQWRLLAILAPSVASDFRDPSADAINVRGSVGASVDLNDELRFGFGLALSYQFGRLLPLPTLSLLWHPNPETLLAVDLPSGIRFSYFPLERLELGAALRLFGGLYEVSANNPTVNVDNLRTTTVDIGPRAAVRLFGPLWLELYGGVTLFRNFEIFESGGDSLFDNRIDNSFVLGVSLFVRPPQPPAFSGSAVVRSR